eukprot:COSAG05_NODE_437_length_9835_cov_3.761915_5_plen_50_part_00
MTCQMCIYKQYLFGMISYLLFSKEWRVRYKFAWCTLRVPACLYFTGCGK